jgi:hypothetical protein
MDVAEVIGGVLVIVGVFVIFGVLIPVAFGL